MESVALPNVTWPAPAREPMAWLYDPGVMPDWVDIGFKSSTPELLIVTALEADRVLVAPAKRYPLLMIVAPL